MGSATLARSILGVAFAAVALNAAQAPSQEKDSAPPTFQASSALVVLPVTVTDKQGRLVPDLPRDRFIVYDNGHPVDIKFFSSEDTPVSVALVIDNSGSMRARHGEVVAAASTFARLSNPDDQLLAITFNDRVEDALDGRTLAAADADALARAVEAMHPDGRTALYDALMVGLSRLDNLHSARKVLILLSDGGDNASQATLEQVLERARRSNVTIYTIGLVDPDEATIGGEKEINPGVLRKLADLSGGERFLPASAGPLMRACSDIAHEIRESYTIGFEPSSSDGTFHHLRVTASDPSGHTLEVRTRPGYVAPGPRKEP